MNTDPPTFDQVGLLRTFHCLAEYELVLESPGLTGAADTAQKLNLTRICDDLELRARQLHIHSSLAQIERFRFELSHDDITHAKLHRLCESLRERIEDDLTAIKFLYIPPYRAGLYENPLLGMDDVLTEFPSVRDDLVESSECYSLGRFPASVFHLMRAFEPCLKAIARELGLDRHFPSWDAYLKAFPEAYEAKFPAKSASDGTMREFYSGVTTYLIAMKNAFRNPTMHKIAATYNERQALDVRQSVHGFMRHLATKLKE